MQQDLCDGTAGYDHLTNFDFVEAITCTYGDSVGVLVMGMLVFGAVILSIYVRTGSVLIPTVLLLTTGGATIALVAPPAVAAATVLLLCSGAGAITFLYYRYSR